MTARVVVLAAPERADAKVLLCVVFQRITARAIVEPPVSVTHVIVLWCIPVQLLSLGFVNAPWGQVLARGGSHVGDIIIIIIATFESPPRILAILFTPNLPPAAPIIIIFSARALTVPALEVDMIVVVVEAIIIMIMIIIIIVISSCPARNRKEHKHSYTPSHRHPERRQGFGSRGW